MTNILQFPTPLTADIDYLLDENGTINGLAAIGPELELYVDSGKISLVGVSTFSTFDDRELAAKFFWACAYYLDSEQRYAEDNYVGLNYDTEDET